MPSDPRLNAPRAPNELFMAPEILQGLLTVGSHHFRISGGPGTEARLINVQLQTTTTGERLVFIYDRAVDDVVVYTDPETH